MNSYERSMVFKQPDQMDFSIEFQGTSGRKSIFTVQDFQTIGQPRKCLKAGHHSINLQKAPYCAGNNAGDFVAPSIWLKQGNYPRETCERKGIDINLSVKTSRAQESKWRGNSPTGARSDQSKNRLVAIQFDTTLGLHFKPRQVGGNLSSHHLACIVSQKLQIFQRVQRTGRSIQIPARCYQNKRVAQQRRLAKTNRMLQRTCRDADIQGPHRNPFKDCMAGGGLQRKVALGQRTCQPNRQLWRYLRVKIVDNAKSQAPEVCHIQQHQRSRSVPQLRHCLMNMHKIGPPSAGQSQGAVAMVDQSLAQGRFKFFYLLRSGWRAQPQIGGCDLQASGARNLFKHLKGAKGNGLTKNLRQDNHCWLEDISGQYTSNNRGMPYMTDDFRKSFTQQEPISEAAIAKAADVMRSGRLHRYNVAPGEIGPVAEFERAFADWLGVPYALALASGGQALQIALRAAGVKPGDRVLTNGFTLAPVPGAIAAVGARPWLVETNENLRPDLSDLEAKAATGQARVLMLSNMRGHLPDMEAVQAICARHGLLLMEDCAHTMGAAWKGKQSGTFGMAGCFSTQTYKHMNSGEGGILTSDDPAFMARATVLSGSYMLFSRHGAGPEPQYFDDARYDMPNCSARMDALRATLLLDQIGTLQGRIDRWNQSYHAVENRLSGVLGMTLPHRPNEESYVGSSIQFLAPKTWAEQNCIRFTDAAGARGVEIKWFGAAEPKAFTSRYDSWHYAAPDQLPQTDAVLARLFDMRLPLTFDLSDCAIISQIIAEEFTREHQNL